MDEIQARRPDGESGGGRSLRVGVISDTHGLFDPRVEQVFEGVDHIIHAGDIGAMVVLDSLAAIAPVTAVRGNVDLAPWATDLPDESEVELNGRRVLVAHVREHVLRRRDPVREGFSVVVVGHSHSPKIDRRDGVLYLNPGSAGRRRFHLPRAVAILTMPPTPGLANSDGAEQPPGLSQPHAEIVILEA